MIHGILAWSAFATVLVILMRRLATEPSRNAVTMWAVVGMALGGAKSSLMQRAPQWLDTPPDSVTYSLHAQALRLHWEGIPVDAAKYQLRGFEAGWNTVLGPMWLADAPISYASALGTTEWGYAAFLALWTLLGNGWQSWAITANVALIGALVGGAYILCLQLDVRKSVAALAALILAVDPLFSVNGLWLLKDTLASFLALTALILACSIARRQTIGPGLVLGLAFALVALASVRFVAFGILSLVLFLVSAALLYRGERGKIIQFAMVFVVVVPLLLVVRSAPHLYPKTSAMHEVFGTVQAASTTLTAVEGVPGFDPSVGQWQLGLAAEPAMAVVKAIARTLMAPYPWTLFTHGISGNNYIELYLPGMVLWILSLPALFAGIWHVARRADAGAWIPLLFLAVTTVVYIAFFGEWSTRQRIFMNPLFCVLMAVGWKTAWLTIGSRSR